MARGVLQRSCRIWPWPRGNGPGSVHPSGLSSRSAAKQGRSSWRYAAALAHLREFEGARRGSHCGASIFLLKKPDFSNIYAYLGLAVCAENDPTDVPRGSSRKKADTCKAEQLLGKCIVRLFRVLGSDFTRCRPLGAYWKPP